MYPRFSEAAAADGPLVVVVEDAHWADPALLGFLEHLPDWSEGVALLVVVTARPELYAAPRPGAAASGTPPRWRFGRSPTPRPRSCSPRFWTRRCCQPRSRPRCWSGPGAIRCTPSSSCA
jgi:hypothetical protein